MNIKRIILVWLLVVPFGLSVNAQAPSGKTAGSPVDYRNFRKAPAFMENIDFSRIDFNLINQVIFHLTNETRTKYKLQPLEYIPELEKSAMMHARDMITEGFFNHINPVDPKKQTPNDRAKLCNIANPYLAENLIEGFGLQYTPRDIIYPLGPGKFSKTPDGDLIQPHTYLSFGEAQMAGWMNSKDHRKNLLSKDALQIGCGVAYFTASGFYDMPSFYVVQNFQCFEPVRKINP